MITGTPAFFDGPQGVQRLAPLAQRLATDFTDRRPLRQPTSGAAPPAGLRPRPARRGRPHGPRPLRRTAHRAADRVQRLVDDAYVATLADAVTGDLGGKVGIAPRLFLKKLVGDVLDRVDQFADFDPRRDYALTVADGELTDVERNAAPASR